MQLHSACLYTYTTLPLHCFACLPISAVCYPKRLAHCSHLQPSPAVVPAFLQAKQLTGNLCSSQCYLSFTVMQAHSAMVRKKHHTLPGCMPLMTCVSPANFALAAVPYRQEDVKNTKHTPLSLRSAATPRKQSCKQPAILTAGNTKPGLKASG